MAYSYGNKTEGWKLVPYIKPDGQCPVHDDFFDPLRDDDNKAYVRFRVRIQEALERLGPQAGAPLWVPLKGGLFEIRWHARWRAHCRIFCSPEAGRAIVMWKGRVKRSDSFDESDRRECNRYREDYLSDDYDQEQREYRYQARKQARKNGLV